MHLTKSNNADMRAASTKGAWLFSASMRAGKNTVNGSAKNEVEVIGAMSGSARKAL